MHDLNRRGVFSNSGSLYTTCTPDVQHIYRMYTTSTPDVQHIHQMYTTCIPDVQHMYNMYTIVHHMYTTCTPLIHHMYTTRTPHVHNMYTTCTTNSPRTCTPHVQHMNTTCIPHVRKMHIVHYIYPLYLITLYTYCDVTFCFLHKNCNMHAAVNVEWALIVPLFICLHLQSSVFLGHFNEPTRTHSTKLY